jgi:hypothetical protein
MATSSVQSLAFSLIACPVLEKLAKNNYNVWSRHVLSAINGARLGHFLDTATAAMPPKQIALDKAKPDELSPNPDYDDWLGKDQTIFNYLHSSVSKDVQVQVSSYNTTAELWKSIQDMTAAQSRDRVINTPHGPCHHHQGHVLDC